MTLIYRIIYSSSAIDDLNQIVMYLHEIAWPSSVKKWINKILDKIDSLRTFPDGHPKYEYDNRFRSVRVGRYRIIYEVCRKERIVSILRIVYARRDLRKVVNNKILVIL